ncbi:uncharacterized protein LOC133778801 [Humulus lupulus]|uniref:uncharacterized protein LOC133778801 n=1 Tax=Humulus lupulus TaxID=3486 RepID=UPI002B408645|nr:uncharacterized protein LOC133778801 [Humulus lupulus]
MSANRLSEEYKNGVDFFLRFCLENGGDPKFTCCPCLKCFNVTKLSFNKIKEHLFFNGIDISYKIWYSHGEKPPNIPDPPSRISKVRRNRDEVNWDSLDEMIDDARYGSIVDPNKFETLLSDAEKLIYPDCKRFTKLSTLLRLFNLKAKHGWSDRSLTELLSFLKELLPECNEMPMSFYEAKKTICSLAWKSCPTCGESRWKKKRNGEDVKEGIPAKVLWYLPPIPRFIRLFRNAELAKSLSWHANERVKDGLSTDGINPHNNLSSKYSCWPVMLVIYNLPPWLCMKKKFTLLTLLISGPKQPGNDIDVYLAPLIDDLKTLWNEGVRVYDAYKQEEFSLRAALLWTINDFPAYGNLSGFSVKGYKACPICEEETCSQYLKHSRKVCYMGHRKFLKSNHILRTWKKAFNGEQEFGEAPRPLSGSQVLEKMSKIIFKMGKSKVSIVKKRKGRGKAKVVEEPKSCYKKKSIFFELEYWELLLSKDGIKAREDLTALKIRNELAPKPGNGQTFLPPACYTLTKDEKREVYDCLFNIKVPDGYCSNIRSLVDMKTCTLTGMKSHDCHILMQHVLPIAIRSVLPKNVREIITRLCLFFKSLCSKEVDVYTLDKLQHEIAYILCKLEQFFPLAFFDIMIHLTVHLVREVQFCGPVYFRWMYPFERYMKILKGYVRNRSRPEGCIIECYIVEEAIEFCFEYMSGVQRIRLNEVINADIQSRRGSVVCTVTRDELNEAHRLVLQNTNELQPYIEQHFNWIKTKFPSRSKNKKWLQDEHYRTFSSWLEQKVVNDLRNPLNNVSDIIKWICRGPSLNVTKFSSYMVNGTKFTTMERDKNRNTQNSGVSLIATTFQVSTSKDRNPIECDMSFYGVIKEIWELDYIITQVPVFFCDWVKSDSGVKKEDLGFTLVNLNLLGHKTYRFIMATQATQVFYVDDPANKQWSVVLTTQSRNWNSNDGDLHDIPLVGQHVTYTLPENDDQIDGDSSCCRENGEGLWIDL